MSKPVFNITESFWDHFPEMLAFEPIKNLYDGDKSRSRGSSSMLMWGIAYAYHLSSPWKNMEESARLAMAASDILKKKPDIWDRGDIRVLRDCFLKMQDTPIKRAYRSEVNSMDKRRVILRDMIALLEDEETELLGKRGKPMTTAERITVLAALDKMQANSAKLLEALDKANKMLLEEQNADAEKAQAQGKRRRSLLESGQI